MLQRCRVGAGRTMGVAEVKCAGVDKLNGASWARASGAPVAPSVPHLTCHRFPGEFNNLIEWEASRYRSPLREGLKRGT